MSINLYCNNFNVIQTPTHINACLAAGKLDFTIG